MEDPITFDIYVEFQSESKKEIEAYLQKYFKKKSSFEIKKTILSSITAKKPLLIRTELAWKEVLELREEQESWFTKVFTTQHQCYIGNSYCEKHDLYYCGIFGCHVCEDFYAKEKKYIRESS